MVQCVIVFTYVSVIMFECTSVNTPELVIVFIHQWNRAGGCEW